jgi:hypothetical protein
MGFRLLAKRLQRPWRAVPAYLLRRLVRAERRGDNAVAVGEGWYLMHRPPAPPPETEVVRTEEVNEEAAADRRVKRLRSKRWFG